MSKTIADLQDQANDFSDAYLALCERANNPADLFAFEQAKPRYAQAPGMYRNPETGAIYRVKMNQAGTNMYVYVLRGESWEYPSDGGGLARNDVRESFRMTLAECDAYSVAYRSLLPLRARAYQYQKCGSGNGTRLPETAGIDLTTGGRGLRSSPFFLNYNHFPKVLKPMRRIIRV